MKMGVRVRCILIPVTVTPSIHPPSTTSSATPEMTRFLKSTSWFTMVEFENDMFSNPPSDPVPSLNPLQHVVRTQFVTTMFLSRRGSCPYGFSLFRQMASSPVSTEQLEIDTF